MPIVRVVKPGECIASIAFEHGFFLETIWSDPANDALRELRKTPYVLAEGDHVVVPDKRPKTMPVATGARHVFRRRGVPEKLVLFLLDAAHQPRVGVGYTLTIDGRALTGTTAEGGRIEHWLPLEAREARLEIETGEVHRIALGGLAPLDLLLGVQQRLRNLGFDCGSDAAGELGPGTEQALRRFCEQYSIALPARWNDEALAPVRAQLAKR